MNLTQWLLLLAPVGLAYLYYVAGARTNGQVNYAGNVMIGLLVVPLILSVAPFFMLTIGIELLRKREWGPASLTLIALLLIAGYGALIFHLRDRPPPSPHDLPVEKPMEKPVDLPVEKQ